MSGYVSGLCYNATFGCATAKAVAVALADHASDDGTKVFPSVRRIAEKVELHPRTVQRALRKLEAMGVVRIVSCGGSGPKDTREWVFDLHLLRSVADGLASFPMTDDKGDTVSPLEDEPKGGAECLKGGAECAKGDTSATQTFTNHQEQKVSAPLPPTTDSSPSGHIDESIWKGSVRPALRILPNDSAWGRWLDHIERHYGERHVERMILAGEIWATTRWPVEGSPFPTVGRAA